MKQILSRGKNTQDGTWVEGYHCSVTDNYTPRNIDYITRFKKLDNGEIILSGQFSVDSATLGRYTDLSDKNDVRIFTGDIVRLLGYQIGVVSFICGSYGILMNQNIDWDYLDSEIAPITNCDNLPYFCRNDFFISFWELMWNYNQEDDMCDVVEIIGNKYDNPELLDIGGYNNG